MVETDSNDRPLEEIKLMACQVFVDPFKEVDEMLERERQALKEKQAADIEEQETPKPGNRREEEALAAAKRAKKRGHNGELLFNCAYFYYLWPYLISSDATCVFGLTTGQSELKFILDGRNSAFRPAFDASSLMAGMSAR